MEVNLWTLHSLCDHETKSMMRKWVPRLNYCYLECNERKVFSVWLSIVSSRQIIENFLESNYNNIVSYFKEYLKIPSRNLHYIACTVQWFARKFMIEAFLNWSECTIIYKDFHLNFFFSISLRIIVLKPLKTWIFCRDLQEKQKIVNEQEFSQNCSA